MSSNNHKHKKDFIDRLMEFTDTELNDYIKSHGKPPKKIEMCHIVNKSKSGSK